MKKCILLLCLLTLPLSGCWSRKEPKDLAIVTSVIYDLNEDKSFKIFVEFMNAKASSSSSEGGQKNMAIIQSTYGNTIPEAIQNVTVTIERELLGAHVDVRFISERFAMGDEICGLMDYILRDYLTNMKPYLVVVKGDHPEELYPALHGYSDYAGDYIQTLSSNQPKSTARGVFVTTYEFMRDYYDEGKEPVMGLIELGADTAPMENTAGQSGSGAQGQGQGQGQGDNQIQILYEGLAAFKGGVLVGYLNGDEARVYNILTNKLRGDCVSGFSDSGKAVVLITHAVTKVNTGVTEGVAVVDIHVKTDMTLMQQTSPINLEDKAERELIEEELSRKLENEIAAVVQKTQQEFGSDIIGFGRQIHYQHPDVWKEIKSQWDMMFPVAEIHVSVDSSINRLGESEQSFLTEEQ